MSVYTILACVSIGALTLYLHHRLNKRSRQQHYPVISTQEYQQQLADTLQFREQKQALQKRLNHLLSDEEARKLLRLEQAWNACLHINPLPAPPSPVEETTPISQADEIQREEVLLHPGLDSNQMAFLRYLINSKKVNEFPEN